MRRAISSPQHRELTDLLDQLDSLARSDAVPCGKVRALSH
jgi:hypothetical protein